MELCGLGICFWYDSSPPELSSVWCCAWFGKPTDFTHTCTGISIGSFIFKVIKLFNTPSYSSPPQLKAGKVFVCVYLPCAATLKHPSRSFAARSDLLPLRRSLPLCSSFVRVYSVFRSTMSAIMMMRIAASAEQLSFGPRGFLCIFIGRFDGWIWNERGLASIMTGKAAEECE